MKLAEIARKSIESHFKKEDFFPGIKAEEEYNIHQASFVTLTKNGKLRGCVGSLIANRPLWEDVKENAIHAAFSDTRFAPLEEKELKEIKIEVSILSEPKPLIMKNKKFIQHKLKRDMGLILRYNGKTATFLPQVWEEIHDKIEFLEHLAKKANLSKDDWKNAELYSFNVKIESE